MNARALAALVLTRVWADGAYAAAALSSELDESSLAPRDRALATEMTYGVLRARNYLERRLGAFAKLKLGDKPLMAHLLVAAYQIDFLDRVPASAAVNEAVHLVRASRGSRLAGFVNALLRKIADSSHERSLSIEEAIFQSSPSWLRKRLLRDVGEEGMRSLLVPKRKPFSSLRLNRPASPELGVWLERHCEAWPSLPGAYRYTAGGDPRKSSGFVRGEFIVQEIGAQLVARALGARVGETVLDVCAGRGQKTSLLASQVGSAGRVVASDLHEHKLSQLKIEMERLQWPVESMMWDWTTPPPGELREVFDRVLVDAPCTGVGTISRRPEIARRLLPEDPARLSELQIAIAKNAALALKPGGVLVFATCSVLRDEAEAVVERLCVEAPLTPSHFPSAVDSLLFPSSGDEAGQCRLMPHTHGSDGYFIAKMARCFT